MAGLIDVRALIERVGPTLLRTVRLPDTTGCVGDVVIAEPDVPASVAEGDLVLGVAVTDGAQTAALTRECGRQSAAAVLLKPPLSTDDEVLATAEEHRLAVVEVSRGTAWAQLVWLIRAALAGSGVEDAEDREAQAAAGRPQREGVRRTGHRLVDKEKEQTGQEAGYDKGQ